MTVIYKLGIIECLQWFKRPALYSAGGLRVSGPGPGWPGLRLWENSQALRRPGGPAGPVLRRAHSQVMPPAGPLFKSCKAFTGKFRLHDWPQAPGRRFKFRLGCCAGPTICIFTQS
jgi:hypothetical protein